MTESGRKERIMAQDKMRFLPFAFCLLLCMVGLLSGAWAQEVPAPVEAGEEVVLNFEGADIREVIHSLATALGLNYTIDPRVQGQVTIRTTGKISKRDLFPVFHQILRAHGIAAVRVDNLYHIVPVGEAKTKAVLPRAAGERRGMEAEDTFVVELVKVEHVSAEEMAKVLQPLVSPGGDVIAYPRGNLLILTDLASNVNRLKDLITTLDVDVFREMRAQVYKIEHADPEELAEELRGILETYEVGAESLEERGIYVLPLARLSSVVVVAFNPTVFPEMEKWLKILDVPPEEGGGRTVHVYAVENTKAADLAAVLSDLYGGTGGGGGRERRGLEGALGRGAGLGREREGGETGLGAGAGGRGRGGGLGAGAGGRGRGRGRGRREGGIGGGTAAAGGTQAVTITPEEGRRPIFKEEVQIVADEITNSLIVLATARDYAMIKEVIKKLDVVPRQVLIEAVIAEVDLTDDLQFGLEFAFASGKESLNQLFGSLVEGGDITGQPKRGVSTLGNRLFATITDRRQFIALLNALAAQSRSRILSTPHIIAADNREAHILIGLEIPILSSQVQQVISPGAPVVNSVQYRDTGKILTILPQVNSAGLVNMEIRQEVSDIRDEEFGSTGSPSFISREAETTVVVQSGESIIIGGIIDDQLRRTRRGVPFLMDLPVLGRAFRVDTDQLVRTEIIVLITPYVIRNREEARSVTKEFQGRIKGLREALELMERERQVPKETPSGKAPLPPKS